MYYISVRTDFSGAHNLRGYKGKCEDLHGHNWSVEAKVCSETLDKLGMVVDFTLVKSCLKDIIATLDHKYLNEIGYFAENNPTSENIAKYIFEKLNTKLSNAKLASVTVWETGNSSATYSG